MATFWIEKLSTTQDDLTKWGAWIAKASASQPDLIHTPAQRETIEKGSRIVVGHRREGGSNSWVYCTTGYVILAGQLKNRISLAAPEIHQGWIET